jgi:hypothetical protein
MPQPIKPEIEALLGERDHLQIKINMLEDTEAPDVTELATLRARVRLLERRIYGNDRTFDTRSFS